MHVHLLDIPGDLRIATRGRNASRSARSKRRLLSGLALLAALVLLPANEASAATWANEQEMVNSADYRSTFVADPGAGSLWGRDDLLARHGSYYRERGFGNVLTWAPRSLYDAAGAARWAGCGRLAGQEIGVCPDGQPLHLREISFGLADTTITALEWDGAFLALACGNFSERQVPGPIPTITGRKFEDVDGDGARGPDEPGLPGWTIELHQGGRLLATTATDASGDYRFALDANRLAISSESFELREIQQPGWEASRSPQPVRVPFGSGDRVFADNDFGNYRPATIEGVKFDDHDVDRQRDAGELGLADWTIGLSGGRSPDDTAVTDAGGRYRFSGLTPGRYIVGETMKGGWRQSSPAGGTHVITVSSGETKNADFGNVCLGTTDVAITHASNGTPISGVEVRLEEIAVPGVLANDPTLPRTTTSGPPRFADLLPGTYRVIAFLPEGVYTTDPDLTVVNGRLAVVKQITVRECAATDVPIKMFPTSTGKVTGGMKMPVPGGFATAGYVFMTRSGVARGSLEYQDHVTGLNLHSDRIEQIHVQDNEAWIGGLVEIGATTYRFALHLVDNGEPGRHDRFELLVENGYRAGYDQTIEGGNDQIHRPERT